MCAPSLVGGLLMSSLSSIQCRKVQLFSLSSVRLIQPKTRHLPDAGLWQSQKRTKEKCNSQTRQDQPTKCEQQRKWCRGSRSPFITLIFILWGTFIQRVRKVTFDYAVAHGISQWHRMYYSVGQSSLPLSLPLSQIQLRAHINRTAVNEARYAPVCQ